MLKLSTKRLVLFSFLICTNILLVNTAPAKSNIDIGKDIGNMVGVAYGAKLMYQEVQPRCQQVSKNSKFKNALDQWENRNKKVLSQSQGLWDKTISTLMELNNQKNNSKQQKELYSKMLTQFSSMLSSMKMTIVNKLNAAQPASQTEFCTRFVDLLNSKKLDVINRDKSLYQKLIAWDEKAYKQQLLKMLQPS